VASNIIYAKAIPDNPSPESKLIDKKKHTLLAIEMGFYMNLGCHEKIQETAEKYIPFLGFRV
jgi:hypothetical protein